MRFSQIVPLSVVVVSALAVPSSNAATPFVVRDIRVEGLQRIEPGTVFNYLPIKVGDTFSDDKGRNAIQALFQTGFFKDVRLQNQDDILIVIVEEQPSIADIEFSGTKQFDKENLKKSLRAIGVAEARYYNKSIIEKAEQELKRQYVARGYYAAEVVATITPLERNRVSIVFTVDEGPAAKIRNINILGNQAFSEKELLSEMQLSTPNWLSWYTHNDQYSKQKLTADLETLRSFYLDKGFLEFKIESAQVSITPDKRDISLTISIHEGERFTVSDITLSGELLGKRDELESKLLLKKGDIFSAAQITASTKAITDILGTYGYAFASITPQSNINQEKRQVAINLLVDPGKRIYIRRINIVGNHRTRDEVIRREMRQSESSWFDSERLKLSRERINRTGYFTDVNVATDEVPNAPDQADVTINVTEKPTGALSLSAGYSTTDKIVLAAGIQQENVFGSGTSLGLNVNTSHVSRTFSLTQFDPYFTIDGVSRVTDLYYRTSRPYYYLGDSTYKIISQGIGSKLGVPFSEEDRVFFGLGFERSNISKSQNSPPNIVKFVETFGSHTNDLPFTIGWSKDNRDSALVPNSGRYQQADLKISIPGGTLRYYQLSYQHQYYYPINKGYTLAFNSEAAYGHGYAGKPYPVTKNLFIGGIGSVRGYETSTIGPSEENSYTKSQVPTGGSSKLIGNVELSIPLPGAGVDRTVRLFTFFDAGAIYQEGQMYRLGDLRYSYGLGFSWISPIGPLKFSYGFPLKLRQGDKTQHFQFQIGTAF